MFLVLKDPVTRFSIPGAAVYFPGPSPCLVHLSDCAAGASSQGVVSSGLLHGGWGTPHVQALLLLHPVGYILKAW